MKFVNRAILIVMPNQAFIDWINDNLEDTEDPVLLDDQIEDSDAYLVDEINEGEDIRDLIGFHFQEIFTHQLSSWFEDESLWPETLSFDLFCEWFTVSYHEAVVDLGGKAIKYEVL